MIPKDELVELGKQHVATEDRVKQLLEQTKGTLEVRYLKDQKEFQVKYSKEFRNKNGVVQGSVSCTYGESLCTAIKEMHNKVFGIPALKLSDTKTTSVEDRLTKIEETLERVAEQLSKGADRD